MCDSITELLHIHDAGYCEEPLNKVNSSCSRNYCKAALWHVILLEADSEDGYTVITKGWTRSATIAGVFLLNNILLVLGAWLADTRQDVFTPNSDPTVWISEQKSKIIGPGNIYPACCCRPCEPQLPVLSLHQWSCAALEVCRPHRDASACLVCSEWLLVLLFLSYQPEAVRPFTSDIDKAFTQRTAAHRIFSLFQTISEIPTTTPHSTALKSPFVLDPELILGLNVSRLSWPTWPLNWCT